MERSIIRPTTAGEQAHAEMLRPTVGEAECLTERDFSTSVLEAAGALVVVTDGQGRVVYLNRACEELTGYSRSEVHGRFLWDTFLAPTEIEPVKALFSQLRAGQLPSEHENFWLDKDGQPRLITWANAILGNSTGQVSYLISTGLDITERQQAAANESARLYCQIEQYADELETLLAVQQAITSRLEPQSVLQLVADAAHRLTNTRLGIVYLLDGDQLRVAVLSGNHNGDLFVGYRMPTADSIAGLAIRSGQAIIINDARHDPRLDADLVRRLRVQSYLAVPLFSNSDTVGAIAVADKYEGELGPGEERILTMLAPGAVIGLENARLYQQEQIRRQEAEERRRIAESLRDILAALNSSQPLDEVLDYIAEQITQLLGSDADAIYRLQAEQEILTIQAAHGLAEGELAVIDIPLHYPILGQVIASQQPVAVVDLTVLKAETNQPPSDPAQDRYLDCLLTHYRAVLAVPLIIKADVYGAIILYYRQPRTFSAEEISLAVIYGNQVALAIENTRLRRQTEQVAVAAERSRLARDLHDSVTQAIFSASLVAEVLPQIWQRDPDEAQRSLADLRHLTRGALAEMRTLLLELRPAALLEAPLDDLLRYLAQAVIGRSQLHLTLALNSAPPLPPDVQVAFYRIAQEGLNNVIKHAEADRLTVRLQTSAAITLEAENSVKWSGRLTLCLQDNGRGFDLDHIPANRLGLNIMRERAESIGANLEIDSQLGRGTTVQLSWSSTARRK